MSYRYTCVIVEDEQDFAKMLQQYIIRLNTLEILKIYGDTTQAAMGIEKLKPDLVFLDIHISGLTGPEFMEMVEHKPQIIVVSGRPPSVMDEYEIEVHGYLQKPFTEGQFVEAVNKCLADIAK